MIGLATAAVVTIIATTKVSLTDREGVDPTPARRTILHVFALLVLAETGVISGVTHFLGGL